MNFYVEVSFGMSARATIRQWRRVNEAVDLPSTFPVFLVVSIFIPAVLSNEYEPRGLGNSEFASADWYSAAQVKIPAQWQYPKARNSSDAEKIETILLDVNVENAKIMRAR